VRGFRTSSTSRWAPRAPALRSYGGAASSRASSVCARGGEGVGPSGADEPESLTAAERAAIDRAAEKMAQRAIEIREWDRTLFWEDIDGWVKVRLLVVALQRRPGEIGVPAADEDVETAFVFVAVDFRLKRKIAFNLDTAQLDVAFFVEQYRLLLLSKTTLCPVCKRPSGANV
jgi:hypothetical protein